METTISKITFTKEEFENFLFDVIVNPQKASEYIDKKLNKKPSSSGLLSTAIDNLAAKLKWKPEKLLGVLDKLKEINIAITFSLVLKQIAIDLDKKYEDHILKSPKLYCISLFDGTICEITPIKHGKYSNIALFRSEEDAKLAIEALEPFYKEMFPDE